MRKSQMQIQPPALTSLTSEVPFFQVPQSILPVTGANFDPRSSTGLALQVILPVVNAPIQIFYGYNWLRLNTVLTPPNSSITNDPNFQALFPNTPTLDQALPFFQGLRLKERKARLGFTVARTF